MEHEALIKNIRNFCIIAHIDAGKSTLADRFLELTGTVEKRKMQEQYLDTMELERERGITIKLAPVQMKYRLKGELDRGLNTDLTRTNTETTKLLYEDLSHKIRGTAFSVKKNLGLGHREIVYQRALEIEFEKAGLNFESQKAVNIFYENKKVGTYTPDFIVEEKIIVELKSLPEIGRPQEEQLWSYLKGTHYQLALLINFGSTDITFKRIVYDLARDSRASADQHGLRADLRGQRIEGQRLSASSQRMSAGVSNQIEEYILNLIDTPGHVDFSYEVSRSLAAVEGAILLVDATKGIQAQTLANLHLAKEQELTIIPAINKVDLPNAKTEQVREEISHLLGIEPDKILEVSGKTGFNVEKLLQRVIEEVPPPTTRTIMDRERTGMESPHQSVQGQAESAFQSGALIFDSAFDAYKGVIAYVRVFGGKFKRGDKVIAWATRAGFDVLETGFFAPKLTSNAELSAGDIGYIATGLKNPDQIRVGDTLTTINNLQLIIDKNSQGSNVKGQMFQPLVGYKEPKPMVFASFFPENAEDYDLFKDALAKLKLTDASLSYEPESSTGLGRGFRLGFLGMLHVEIISERLKREFGLRLIISTPSVEYEVRPKKHEAGNMKQEKGIKIRSATQLPDPSQIESIAEPIVCLEIITPSSYLGNVMGMVSSFRNVYKGTDYLGKDTALLKYEMPLSEVITDFYDKLKSVSSGYASMGYELKGTAVNDLVRLDILISGELVEPFSRIVPRDKIYYEGRAMTAKLKEAVPPQWFEVAIQAAVGGKIIARESIRARRKDVTGYLYGGDVTRKMKLLEKQKKGKKKMKKIGRVNLPQEVFLKMLKR